MLSRLFKRQAPPEPQPFDRFFRRFLPVTVPLPPAAPADLASCEAQLGAPLPAALRSLLAIQNGGWYAGGLLHLPGAGRERRHDSLGAWNEPALWKFAYEGFDLDRYLFFADDAFGNQFGCLAGEPDPAVWRFDVQEGEFIRIADSIDAFFSEVLVEDGPWLLGSDYLDAYRESGAAWQVSQHLMLLTPSLLGGSMAPENLHLAEPVAHLRLAGQIVTQIKPLPPGAEVRGFKVDAQSGTVRVRVAGTSASPASSGWH